MMRTFSGWRGRCPCIGVHQRAAALPISVALWVWMISGSVAGRFNMAVALAVRLIARHLIGERKAVGRVQMLLVLPVRRLTRLRSGGSSTSSAAETCGSMPSKTRRSCSSALNRDGRSRECTAVCERPQA